VIDILLAFLGNALWEIAAITVVAAIGARLMRHAPARQQHFIWIAALVLSVLLPAWSAIPRRMTIAEPQWGAGALAGGNPTKAGVPIVPSAGGGAGAPLVGIALVAYAAFVAIRVGMLLRAWLRTRALVRGASDTGRRISRFGVADVPILTSSTPTPITVGALSPVILFPTPLADALATDVTEALLGHEVAHIRRRDFAVNLALEILALPIVFHPAAALLRRRIAQTRELACDEMVTPALIAPRDYARALVDVAAFASAAHAPAYALAMAGRDFEERVLRIVRRRPAKRATARLLVASIALAATSVAAAAFAIHPRILTVTKNVAVVPTPNKDAQSRAAYACAAGRAHDDSAIPQLVAMLGDDTPIADRQCYSGMWSPARSTFDHPSPGEQAALALAAISRPSLPSLINALNDASPIVRRNAAWAIGEIRGGWMVDRSDAVAPLIALTADRDASVRRAAAFGLSELKARVAIDPLIRLLNEPDATLRTAAAYALGEIKASRAAPKLRELHDRDPDPEVRRAAKWALAEITD